jgi:hypothetical protein
MKPRSLVFSSFSAVPLILVVAQACSSSSSSSGGDAGGSPDGTTGHDASSGSEGGPGEAASEGGQGDALAETGPEEAASEAATPEGSVEASTDAPEMDAPVEATLDAPVEAALDAPADVTPDATEAAAPWTPTSLGSALVLWLNGDKGTTTTPCGAFTCLTAWADQSTFGNNAAVATGGTSPTFGQVSYNGHPAATFDGNSTGTASLAIADATSLQFTTGYTLMVVAYQNMAGAPHIGALYGKTNAASPYAGTFLAVDFLTPSTGAAGTQVDIFHNLASAQTGLDGALHVYLASYDPGSGNLTIAIDDNVPRVTAVPATNVTAPGVDAYIGGRPNSSQVVGGSIVEVVAGNVPFTNAQLTSAYPYFKAKYGASLP